MTSRRGFNRKTIEDKVKRDPAYAARLRKILSEDIGDALRGARQEAGVSQKAVAERMGVSESRVTQIEGEAGASITLRTLRRFASAVGCRLDIELVNVATNDTVSKVIVTDDLVDDEALAAAAAAKRSKYLAAWSSNVVTVEIGKILIDQHVRSTQIVSTDLERQLTWFVPEKQERYARAGV